MKVFTRKVLVLLVISVYVFSVGVKANTGNELLNETVWRDVSGDEILSQGGSIIEHNGYYYWFGVEFPGSEYVDESTYYFNAIRCYKSSDLKSWAYQGDALSKQSSGVLSKDHWVGRPTVTYNSSTNKFVLHFEWAAFDGAVGDDGVHGNRLAVATCDTVDGQYQWIGQSKIDGYTIGDLSIFKDTNGDAYAVYVRHKLNADDDAMNWNERLAITKLSSDYLSPSTTVWTGYVGQHREAPFILKKDAKYYLFSSFTDYWNSTETKYATANSISGSWSSLSKLSMNPDSSDSFNSQVDFILPIYGSQMTSYVYCGDRWSNFDGASYTYKYDGVYYNADYYNSGQGRYIWLPMTFEGVVPKVYWAKEWDIDTNTGIWTIDNYGINTLKNWSFENNMTSWENWGNSAIVSSNIHSGSKALRIGQSSGGVGQYLTSGFQTGNVYHTGGWAKMSKDGDFGWIILEALDSSYQVLDKAAVKVDSRSYAYHDVTLTIPEGTDMLRVVLWKDTNTAGYLYIDDVTLSN